MNNKIMKTKNIEEGREKEHSRHGYLFSGVSLVVICFMLLFAGADVVSAAEWVIGSSGDNWEGTVIMNHTCENNDHIFIGHLHENFDDGNYNLSPEWDTDKPSYLSITNVGGEHGYIMNISYLEGYHHINTISSLGYGVWQWDYRALNISHPWFPNWKYVDLNSSNYYCLSHWSGTPPILRLYGKVNDSAVYGESATPSWADGNWHTFKIIRYTNGTTQFYLDNSYQCVFTNSNLTSSNKFTMVYYQSIQQIDNFWFRELDENNHVKMDGTLTSIVKDAENITGGQTGDVFKILKIDGKTPNGTWFQGYWNYSWDNVTYYLQNLGNITVNTNYTLINARYGSFIIKLIADDISKTPELYNVTLYSSADDKHVLLAVSLPINTTYTSKNITISGSTNRNANITYSLNGASNISVCNNCTSFNTWTNSTVEGSNNIKIYAVNYINSSDTDSKTIYFTVDQLPTSNHPDDASYIQGDSASIGWILYDDVAPGYYYVKRNGIIQNSTTIWTNGTNLNVWVNTSTIGIWNYTIYFNDSFGNENSDEVIITIHRGQENLWTVGSGGDNWNKNVNYKNITEVQATGYVELRQLVDDYVSYWRFDEGSGTTVHDENEMNENDGTTHNMNNTNWVSGKYGNALDFDGSNDYITFGAPTPSTLQLNNSNLTIVAWINKSSTDPGQRLFCNRYSGSPDGYAINFYSDDLRFSYGNGTSSETKTTELYNDKIDSWSHIAITFDCSTRNVSFYQDGHLIESFVFSQTGCIAPTIKELRLGSDPDGNSLFNGILDDIRVYNRVLSSTEINQTMNNEHYTLGSLNTIMKDAENITYGQIGDVWWRLKIEGKTPNGTWLQGYWNYSSDNLTYNLEDLGNLSTGTYYTFSNPARYGSLIIELNTNNASLSPCIHNITLYSGEGLFVNSPMNITYASNNITISGSTTYRANITYSLNGASNISVCNNCTSFNTWTNSTVEGSNNIKIYAVNYINSSDTDSKTIYFTINTIPPATITNLINQSQGETWIYWNWTNPSDSDFDHTEIWINGTFMENTSDNHYNATGLTPYTWYEIQTRTVDNVGNINTTWVNDTAKTIDITPPIITFVSPTPNNQNTINTWAYVNITTNEPCVWSRIEWNGINESWDGNVSSTNFYINKTNLDGNYTFKAYCNDSAGNMGVSKLRWVNTNVSPSFFDDWDENKFWVSPNGDDSCTGQWQCTYYECGLNCSWATITYAATQAQAGDTVYIKGNNYGHEHVVIENSGNEENPITFEGYDGIAELDGEDQTGYGIYMSGKSYIVLKNFELKNYAKGVRAENSHHLTIDNLTFYHMGSESPWTGQGISFAGVDYSVIRNCEASTCTVHNIYFASDSDHNLVENCHLYISTGEDLSADYGIYTENSHDNIIKNCVIENLHPLVSGHHGHGIALRWNSYNNKIINCTSYGLLEHWVVGENGYNNEFINCTAYDSGAYNQLGLYTHGLVSRMGAYNNKFINCKSIGVRHGISLWTDSATTQQDNIYQNCIVDGAQFAIYLYNASNTSIRNCVITNSDYLFIVKNEVNNSLVDSIITNTDYRFYGGGGWEEPTVNIIYCNFWGNGFVPPSGVGNINKDPLFADPANGDFHLKSQAGRWNGTDWITDNETSPCIDAGDPSEKDPDGTRINMGAYGGTSEASKSQSAATGTLTGTVTDKDTGAPIEGAVVSTNGYSDTTDASGNYSITLPIGNYTITASKTGYQSQSKSAEVFENRTTEVNFTLTVVTTTITTTSTTSTSTTTTLGTTTTTTISTTTTIIWPCDLPGDYPTCGEVTLEEVVDFINLWSLGQADLEDVVNLINAWAEGPVCELPGDYPPCGEVTLEEVVDFINLWSLGQAELGDVVNLINAWAGS